MKKYLACALFGLLPVVASADTGYHITDRQVLPGNVQWDYLSYEPQSHRLFLTRGDHVDVFDTQKKQVVGSIPGTHGVHGVALAPELDRAFVSAGKDNTVSIVELSTLKVLGTVPTGQKPDAIVYDPASKRVFAANGADGSLTVIDAVSGKVQATIAIGGKLEFAVVDARGSLFVNVEDKGQLAAVDTQSLVVKARYDLASVCEEPGGLAIDRAGGRLFATCGNQKMLVVDAGSGKILDVVGIGKGSDAALYDPERKLAFSSNGEGNLSVVGQGSDGHYLLLQTLPTARGARTMTLNPLSHELYLVTAEPDPAAAPDPQHPGRLHYKPDSFVVLTVAP